MSKERTRPLKSVWPPLTLGSSLLREGRWARRDPNRDPKLPVTGEHVRLTCLEPLGLSVTDGAKALGVSRQALSSLLNARAGISPDMAVRLSKAFGSSARHWMQLQMNYDLWQADQRADKLDVKRLVPA